MRNHGISQNFQSQHPKYIVALSGKNGYTQMLWWYMYIFKTYTIYIYMYTIYVYIYIYMHTHTYIYVCMYTHINAYITQQPPNGWWYHGAWIRIHTGVCMYIYIYTHLSIYTHTLASSYISVEVRIHSSGSNPMRGDDQSTPLWIWRFDHKIPHLMPSCPWLLQD